jgi:hypothetical protein
VKFLRRSNNTCVIQPDFSSTEIFLSAALRRIVFIYEYSFFAYGFGRLAYDLLNTHKTDE